MSIGFRTHAGLLLSLLAAPAFASEAVDEAVKELGALSGVALHCKYMQEVQRTKAAVAANVPTQRHFGAIFENANNVAFLTAVQEQSTCPPKESLAEQVDAAANRLKEAVAQAGG